ncbi:N-acetylmuramoyl-L-alanine amidase [Thermodesulfitimonas sp.]
MQAFFCLLGAASAVAGQPQAVFVVGQKSYTAGGQAKAMDAAPFIADGRTYVPVRYLALALGVPEAGISWDGNTASVTLNRNGVTLRLTVGENILQVNGQEKKIDAVPVLKDGRTYLPVRCIVEAFGFTVNWDESARAVSVFPAVEKPPVDQTKTTSSNPVKKAPVNQVVVKGSVVNIRSGPGINHAVIAQVTRGDRLVVAGADASGDWYLVNLPSGTKGWIASWLVTEAPSPSPAAEKSSTTAPVPPAAKANPPVTNPAPEPSRGSDHMVLSVAPTLPGAAGSPANALTSLTVTQDGEVTRVTVRAGVPLSYHTFRLSGPDRLVVDLPGIQPGNQPPVLMVDSPLVQDVRVGYYSRDPDITRLVFNLKQHAACRVELAGDQKTLAVEISVPQPGDLLREATVVLDPGHGGRDPGAIGPSGLQEKSVTLIVARRVADLLTQQGVGRVVLTRTDDSYVGLVERTALAAQVGATVFVSIHMNACYNPAKDGTATYYVSTAGVDDTVQYQGASPQMAEQRQQESARLASCIQTELVKRMGLPDDGVRQANFVVLRTATMPAVLVEVAYISNPQEETQMTTDGFVTNAAQGIAQGIINYLTA